MFVMLSNCVTEKTNVPWFSRITVSVIVILGDLNVSLLCVSWQRFAIPFVVGTEEIGSSVLFVSRASSAGKAISRSDPPMTEYRPLKSQPRSRGRARHKRVLHFPRPRRSTAAIWRATAAGRGLPSFNTRWLSAPGNLGTRLITIPSQGSTPYALDYALEEFLDISKMPIKLFQRTMKRQKED